MRPGFLMPEQTLLEKTTRLLNALRRLPTPLTGQTEIIAALTTAQTAFSAANQKYKNNAATLTELTRLHAHISQQTPLYVRDVDAATAYLDQQLALATDANTGETSLQQLLNAHLAPAANDDNSSEFSDSDDSSDSEEATFRENVIQLFQGLALLRTQLDTIAKNQEALQDAWNRFVRLSNTTDRKTQKERAKTLKEITSTLIQKLHEIQTAHKQVHNDFGIQGLLDDLLAGPSQLLSDFEAGIEKAQVCFNKFHTFAGQPQVPTSPTNSSSSMFSSESSDSYSSTASETDDTDEATAAPQYKQARTG